MTTIPLPAGYRSPSFTARPSRAGYGGRAATPIRGGTIRPYVVPWTRTTDDFGVAIPSGCVGVVTGYNLPTAGDPNYPLDADYATDIREMLDKNAYPVPGVLPSGYTLRLARDAWAAVSQAGNCHGQIVTGLAGGSAVYQRTASGLGPPIYWRPALVVNGGYPTSAPIGGSSVDYAHALLVGQHHGWRKLRCRVGCAGPSASWSISGGDVGPLIFSHNADGSAVTALFGDGDTNDATVSFTPAEYSFTGISLGSPFWLWQTGWKDVAAPLYPTHGVATRFYVRDFGSAGPLFSFINFSFSGGATSGGAYNFIDLQESYRVDIPFPFTATGEGDLIAPGGTV